MIKKISKYGGGKQTPALVVIHSMAEYIKTKDGVYSAIDYLEKIKLSAHFFIHPNGQIVQGREIEDVAYHAKGYNTNSIGIEFLVEGTHNYGAFLNKIKTDYVTDIQFQEGVSLVHSLMGDYDINELSRHSDLSPERKVDPGEGFNWYAFLIEIQ